MHKLVLHGIPSVYYAVLAILRRLCASVSIWDYPTPGFDGQYGWVYQMPLGGPSGDRMAFPRMGRGDLAFAAVGKIPDPCCGNLWNGVRVPLPLVGTLFDLCR
jgi:hypothetical protein